MRQDEKKHEAWLETTSQEYLLDFLSSQCCSILQTTGKNNFKQCNWNKN